jgi:hypothetical protein
VDNPLRLFLSERTLHVSGDYTLTLKARIPAGGGLWKGGIESGMLTRQVPGCSRYVRGNARQTHTWHRRLARLLVKPRRADGDYVPGMDFSEDFHVFALDWHENRPIWLLDGHPIKQVYYEWNAPPAHVLVTNQLGIEFIDKEVMKQMKADESNWDYVIDYIRVWQRQDP